MKSAVQTNLITDYDKFLDVRDRWNELADSSESDCVFLRHEWFDAAWQWLKDECDLMILAVFQNEDIIGLWPLVLRRRKHRFFNVRSIEFITVPDTQICDAICRPEHQEIVVDALRQHLRTNPRSWDMCILEKLLAVSPTTQLLRVAQYTDSISFDVEDVGKNPQVKLHGTWANYYARRSKRLRKGNKLVANRLNKSFDKTDIRWIRTLDAGENDVADALDRAIDVSRRSWKSETGGSLDNPGPAAFIEKLSTHAVEQGWLSLWLLELEGRAVAMEYQLSYAGNVHALRGDFDSEMSNMSPGTFLNWKLLERLFDENFDYYHMGPGNNDYKMRWAEDASTLGTAIAYSSSILGRAISFVDNTLRPIVKRSVEWLYKLRQRNK